MLGNANFIVVAEKAEESKAHQSDKMKMNETQVITEKLTALESLRLQR